MLTRDLEVLDTAENLQIPGYTLHLNSNGKGKGIAIYYKDNIANHQIILALTTYQHIYIPKSQHR